MKDHPYNKFGLFVWFIHNILLGPEYDLSPVEAQWIRKWGMKPGRTFDA